jgi:hypothetical protein
LVVTAFARTLIYVLLGSARPWSGKWIWLGPFVLDMGIIFMAERQLQGKVWIDEELGPLRRLLNHPAWNVLVGIPFLILLIMLSIRRLDHHIVPWVFLILPSQTVMRLQQIVNPR